MYDYEYPPLGGGGGVSHHVLARELARRHEVLVVTSAFEDLPRREIRDGVEIHRVPVWARKDRSVASVRSLLSFPPGAWVHAARHLRRRAFDVVNSQFAVPTGPGGLPVARIKALPHVLTIHGGDIFDPSKRLSPHRLPLVRAAVARVLRSSAAVVAQSTDTRDKARRFYAPELDIRIIPLAIQVPEVTVRPRVELGLPEGVFLAVTVGRIVARKGLDLLLEALARPAAGSVHLVVIGNGPEKPMLERQAVSLGIEERVRFTGWVEERVKWQVLAASDAYLSATMHEGYGLVFLEAMAMGLPVVVPDHGGHLDFLEDGVTGRIVPRGDVAALARATSELASRREWARQIGRANRERSHREHRPEVMAARYEEVFAEVVDERAPPA